MTVQIPLLRLLSLPYPLSQLLYQQPLRLLLQLHRQLLLQPLSQILLQVTRLKSHGLELRSFVHQAPRISIRGCLEKPHVPKAPTALVLSNLATKRVASIHCAFVVLPTPLEVNTYVQLTQTPLRLLLLLPQLLLLSKLLRLPPGHVRHPCLLLIRTSLKSFHVLPILIAWVLNCQMVLSVASLHIAFVATNHSVPLAQLVVWSADETENYSSKFLERTFHRNRNELFVRFCEFLFCMVT